MIEDQPTFSTKTFIAMTRTDRPMNAEELRKKVRESEDQLKRDKAMLAQAEKACQHAWSEVVYDPIIVEGYYQPGDREMGIELGIDSRPGMHVPRQETKRWRRTCSKCKKVEFTTYSKAETQITHKPTFH